MIPNNETTITPVLSLTEEKANHDNQKKVDA